MMLYEFLDFTLEVDISHSILQKVR